MYKFIRPFFIAICMCFVLACSFKVNAQAMGTKEEVLLDLVNAQRTANGLKKLTFSADLQRAAETRSKESANVFSHTRPDGSEYFTAGKNVMGENLAKANSCNTMEEVVSMWMNSPSHKENILWTTSTATGISVYTAPDGTMYIAQEFN